MARGFPNKQPRAKPKEGPEPFPYPFIVLISTAPGSPTSCHRLYHNHEEKAARKLFDALMRAGHSATLMGAVVIARCGEA